MFSHGLSNVFPWPFRHLFGTFLNHLTSTAALRSPRGEDPPGYTAKTRPRICRAGWTPLFFGLSEIWCWKIIRWRRCFEKQQHCEDQQYDLWFGWRWNPTVWLYTAGSSRGPHFHLFFVIFWRMNRNKNGYRKNPGVWTRSLGYLAKLNHTMWGPPVISWFINPINYSYWSYKPT